MFTVVSKSLTIVLFTVEQTRSREMKTDLGFYILLVLLLGAAIPSGKQSLFYYKKNSEMR